jgi:hypothetical protein
VSGWSDCFIWATLLPAASTDDDLLARQLVFELLTGGAGLLDKVSSTSSTRSTGCATLPGTRSDLLVFAWPTGQHTRSLAAALYHHLPELLAGHEGAAEVAKARARLRSRLAFEQQSPGGLVSMLLQYALARGAWPEIDRIDAVRDAHVIDLATQVLRNAGFWRITDGRLEEVTVKS